MDSLLAVLIDVENVGDGLKEFDKPLAALPGARNAREVVYELDWRLGVEVAIGVFEEVGVRLAPMGVDELQEDIFYEDVGAR
jgi:hypothetical protein